MSGFEHDYIDPDGAKLHIQEYAGRPETAFLDQYLNRAVLVPAHRLAEFTAALYAAAGQPAPDLPVIHDPALVDALVLDLLSSFVVHPPSEHTNEIACRLLAAGWRKPQKGQKP